MQLLYPKDIIVVCNLKVHMLNVTSHDYNLVMSTGDAHCIQRVKCLGSDIQPHNLLSKFLMGQELSGINSCAISDAAVLSNHCMKAWPFRVRVVIRMRKQSR